MDCKRCDKVIPKDNLRIATASAASEYAVCHSTCDSKKIEDPWVSLEEYLIDNDKEDGWHTAKTEKDRLKHYILNRIIYYTQETPDRDRDECEFDEPDPQDIVRLLWRGKKPIAFYTVKPKGQFIETKNEYYALPTLDTAFVRKNCRRQGNGIKIIQDFVNSYPDEEIGFSSPISRPMLKVIDGYLSKHTEHRLKLWQISGSGAEGQRKLIWFTLNKMKRSLKQMG